MKLYRLKLRPTSPWRTPWQSDTLAGMLCATLARLDGGEALRREMLAPAAAGRPPWVVSDAFPGDLLPAPLHLRLQPWPAELLRMVSAARWLRIEDFREVQQGRVPAAHQLLSDEAVVTDRRLRKTVSRLADDGGEGGGCFAYTQTLLDARSSVLDGRDYLSVYARVAAGFEQRVLELFTELSETGFGADASSGSGQFELLGGFEDAGPLLETGATDGANAVVVLSTFQPSAVDPTDGLWETFTKQGRLGPDFGLDDVRKRPLVLMRPGAVFRTPASLPFLGRQIPGDELLPADAAGALATAGHAVAHQAFGLAVPLRW